MTSCHLRFSQDLTRHIQQWSIIGFEWNPKYAYCISNVNSDANKGLSLDLIETSQIHLLHRYVNSNTDLSILIFQLQTHKEYASLILSQVDFGALRFRELVTYNDWSFSMWTALHIKTYKNTNNIRPLRQSQDTTRSFSMNLYTKYKRYLTEVFHLTGLWQSLLNLMGSSIIVTSKQSMYKTSIMNLLPLTLRYIYRSKIVSLKWKDDTTWSKFKNHWR